MKCCPVFIALILITPVILGALLPVPAGASGPIKVAASILPQKHFLERIGGGLLDVSVMVGPGANPHTYEPKPRQMADLAETRAYFAIGVTFEDAWLSRISGVNPAMYICRTDEGVEKRSMAAHHHGEEQGPDGPPGTARPDPHIWTSPPLVKRVAANTLRGLIAADRDNASLYRAHYEAFVQDVTALDRRLRRLFAGKEGSEFMVFHPSWGYFAQAYGLHQIPVEIEGKEPKPAQLQHLIEYAKERGIKAVFAQPQISQKSARMLAKAIGGRVVLADPLAEDWPDGLMRLAEELGEAFK